MKKDLWLFWCIFVGAISLFDSVLLIPGISGGKDFEEKWSFDYLLVLAATNIVLIFYETYSCYSLLSLIKVHYNDKYQEIKCNLWRY